MSGEMAETARRDKKRLLRQWRFQKNFVNRAPYAAMKSRSSIMFNVLVHSFISFHYSWRLLGL